MVQSGSNPRNHILGRRAGEPQQARTTFVNETQKMEMGGAAGAVSLATGDWRHRSVTLDRRGGSGRCAFADVGPGV